MQQYRTPTLWMLLIAVMGMIGGCSKGPDQRLTELAESSLAQQSRQNEAAAENNRQIAEAARQLVQADAHAREQLIRSNREQQAEIQQSYNRLDQARDDLERERQAIAEQRQRDPVVAEAIRGLGLLLAVLFPLGVAGYLLYVINRAAPMRRRSANCSLQRLPKTSDRCCPRRHRGSKGAMIPTLSLWPNEIGAERRFQTTS